MKQPAHEQAQRALIHTLVLRPMEFHGLDLTHEDFNLPDCKRAFEAISELWAEGTTPDVLTIADWTEANKGKTLDALELSNIGEALFSWQTLDAAQIIKQASIDRRVRVVADRLAHSDLHGDEVLAEALTAFNDIGTIESKGAVKLTIAVRDLLDDLKRKLSGGTGTQILTGLPALDDHQFIERGGVLTIAGRPSMGKSTLAQFLAQLWAQEGERILMFSTETPAIKVAKRFLAAELGINTRDIGGSGMSLESWERVKSGAVRLHDKQVWIDDQSATAGAIARSIRLHRQTSGITIAIVDHIQECVPGVDPRNELNQLISAIRAACREVPKIALVMVSQLSRKTEGREDRIPRLSDLRESGKIEEVSDAVLLLFRPFYYNGQGTQFANADKGLVKVNVAKNRDGSTGWFGLSWDHDNGQIRGMLSLKQEDNQ